MDLRERMLTSYPAAVVRRFFELEMFDRAFGLAAQAFVSLLPLVIVIVSLFVSDPGVVISGQIGERFGLDDVARGALRSLFSSTAAVVTISWLAVLMSLLSAFSLSRRLSRVYASIFGLPSLGRSQLWRGLVWIALQIALMTGGSALRDVRREAGAVGAMLAIVLLLSLWFLADAGGLRLLVPSIPRHLMVPSAALSSLGRIGVAAWAAIYMPRTLSEQAELYGPIGVTFAIFTYILVGVFVYVGAPLLVAVWISWRESRREPVLVNE
jgi:membrane protein